MLINGPSLYHVPLSCRWNNLGQPESTTHSDGTFAVSTQYDRAGRPKTLSDAAGTHTYDYSVPLQVTETITGGILAGITRIATRDTHERPSGLSVTSGTSTHSTAYQYNPTSPRLEKVTTGTENATYGYLPNSDAIQTLTFKSGTTTRLTTTRSYDASDRLDGVTNGYGSSQLQTFGVSEFDAMNRRKKITREDATRWAFGYNDKGEVTSGIREKTSTSAPVPGWSHGYTFDEIGNRLTASNNGRVSTYTPNALNQYETRTVPRAFDVIGKAATTAAVTVNSLPSTRLDEFFYKDLPAGSGAVHVPYSVAATDGTGTTTRTGGKFLPATPEPYDYDDDGNLTTDGRVTYTWDAENRLIAMETLPAVPTIAKRKLSFAYDAMSRRIRKTTWHGTASGTWQLQQNIRFIHQLGGWNIIAEVTGEGKFLRTYTWGTDLSGSLSGAGGVGGLLFTKIHGDNSVHAHGMDLNGNVSLLVSTTTGQATATYDYGAFGEPLRQSGEYAILSPYRFSTKYTDDETGLLDYGYRYYDPVTGHWLSKDPIGERGRVNLYGFVGNDGINKLDFMGLNARAYARSKVQEAAGVVFSVYEGYASGMWQSLYDKFFPTLFDVNFVSYGPGPQYHPLTGMQITTDEYAHNVLHELVHAYNSPSFFNMMDDRKDEGMAHAFEFQYSAIESLKILQDNLNGSDKCSVLRTKANSGWRSVWGRLTTDASGAYNEGKTAFTLTGNDFDNVNASFNTKMSCKRTADALNRITTGADRCCIKFLCEAGKSEMSSDGGSYNVRYANPIFQTLK